MEFSSKIYINASQWDAEARNIAGTGSEVEALRARLEADRQAILKIMERRQAEMEIFGMDYTIGEIIREFKTQKKNKHD